MSATTGAVGGKERAGGANTFLVILLIAAIVLAVVDFAYLTYNANQDAKAGALVTKVQVLSQQLSKVGFDAAGGNIDAFKSLEQTRNAIDDLLKKFKGGDTSTGMTGYGGVPELSKEITDIDRAWAQLNTDATKILSSKEQVLSTAQAAADGLARDAQFYGVVLAGLINGNPDLNIRAMDNASAKEILSEINKQWV